MRGRKGFTPLESSMACHGDGDKYKFLTPLETKSLTGLTERTRSKARLFLTGFTLMELMIVIAIIMILSAAIVARITTGTEKAKYAKANGEMAEIAAAIRAFYMDTGYWTYNNTGFDSTTGDAGLISKDHIVIVINDSGSNTDDAGILAAVKAKWKGPYLEAMEWPKDPWGVRHYWVYFYNGGPNALYVLCYGPDANRGEWDNTKGKVAEGSDDVLLLVHRF